MQFGAVSNPGGLMHNQVTPRTLQGQIQGIKKRSYHFTLGNLYQNLLQKTSSGVITKYLVKQCLLADLAQYM